VDAARVRRLTEHLQARARPPLPADLITLNVAGVRVGNVQPEIAHFIAERIDGFILNDGVLTIDDEAHDIDARTALLAKATTRLREAGLIAGWRDENLGVGTPPVAIIERAACRPLGITTEAVHLNAYTGADTLLVARRAPRKQIDPGRWDNLVGGMVPAGESLQQALAREAFEEAGLQLDDIELQRGRWFQMRRPVPEGLQSEIIHVYDALLPDGLALQNQDGEVDAIERRTLDEVINAIENDEFTLESALVTLESVTRRARIDTPTGFFHLDYEISSIHAI
jgi:8-oxo-dGTP pyrophosphatase MutT (NUDIX family)